MVFIESKAFTKRISEFLADDELAQIQADLVGKPMLGDVIRGTGGLRKLRVPDRGRGKGRRGGARVIYLHLPDRSHLHLLLVYGKDEQDDLTAEQRNQLRGIVARIKSA